MYRDLDGTDGDWSLSRLEKILIIYDRRMLLYITARGGKREGLYTNPITCFFFMGHLKNKKENYKKYGTDGTEWDTGTFD
jgi:hypothetical protein